MIKRVTADGSVLVTFELSSDVAFDSVFVCGDFNGWTHSHPLEFEGDAFRTTLRLEPGRAYRFRYFFDGGRWENDWAADAYVPNEFGGEDSVVDLTALTGSAPPQVCELLDDEKVPSAEEFGEEFGRARAASEPEQSLYSQDLSSETAR